MALPKPEPGLVISYGYLWRREHRRGREDAVKNRPAVIVLATEVADGVIRVVVAPITHSPPRTGDETIELPGGVKRQLGLDEEKSWVVLDEANRFTWPGYDLDNRSIYGLVPPQLYREILGRMLGLAQARRLREISRD